MGRPTRNDVAQFARVSGATVSRVLSGRSDLAITPETRDRVLAAAQKLGYLPNPTARALVTGRSQIIGLWTCLDYSRYRSQVVARMQRLLRQSDYCMAISDIEEEIGLHHAFSRATRVPADGIIAFDTPTASAHIVQSGNAENRPFVSMGAYWDPRVSYVGVDLGAGALEAVRHLVAAGRRKIAFLALLAEGEEPAKSRRDAYLTVLQEAGMPVRFLETTAITVAGGEEAVALALRHPDPPDAVFCLNDELAIGAYRAIAASGRRVGGEIAVVGCDGIEETELLSYPITTIKQPVDQMCALAWEFLQRAMAEPHTPLQQRILKPELVIHASSAG